MGVVKKRPKRLDYPNGVYGDISYNKQLNKYCSYLENRLKEQQKKIVKFLLMR